MPKKTLLTLVLPLAFYLLFFGSSASAARLFFEAQKIVPTNGNQFSINIIIDAPKPVNAVAAAIAIPPELDFLQASNGNSIISLWLDNPSWDETTRLVTFSGITPGGFSGENGRLLTIKLAAKNLSPVLLEFNRAETKALLHSPDGAEDELELGQIMLPLEEKKQAILAPQLDTVSPEPFTPEIARNENVFADKWFLAFAAQDKDSGIRHYELAEKRGRETTDYTKLDWQEAESPYLLDDQKLRSYIYVKAVDYNDNERIMILPPRRPSHLYTHYRFWVIILMLLTVSLSAGYYVAKKNKKK